MKEKAFINLNNNTGYSPRIKKPLIITLAIIVVMVIAAIFIVAFTPKTDSTSNTTNNEPTIDKTADFTSMQKLFAKLCGKEAIVDFMEEQYFKDLGKFEITTLANRTGRIDGDSDEYITYDIVNEEDDSPDTAVNFAYHQTIDNQDTFIIKSGEKAYQHFNGAITNEFDNLEDAILDHQLFQ